MKQLTKLWSFYQENGGFVLISALAARPGTWVRNRGYAAQFGVPKIRIGPRSYVRGLRRIRMGADFTAGEGLWLEAVTSYRDQTFSPNLTIGDHVGVSHWCHIACSHSVTIGNHVLIGSKVLITDHHHGRFGDHPTSPRVPPGERPLESGRSVWIGDNVFLGDGVVVCPGVTIGEGSIVGANAVVTTSLPAYTLAAGVPCQAIRRFDHDAETWVRV